MGKGSKTRARAVKLAKRAGLPDLAPSPKRRKDGRKASSHYDRTAADGPLQTRCRHMGWKEDETARAKAPSLECDAGRVLHALCEADEIPALWDVYARLTAAEESYVRHKIGGRLHAKTAKIEMAPERFETRADDVIDTRTDEEKLRDATNRWMRWQGYLGCLDSHQQSAIQSVVRGRSIVFRDGYATPDGRVYVSALRKLADVVSRH